MSEQDKMELAAEIIKKGKAFDKKWNIYKILSVVITIIICMIGSTWYIAYRASDWATWRVNYTKKVDVLDDWKEDVQTSLNYQRAEYNRNVKIKGQ